MLIVTDTIIAGSTSFFTASPQSPTQQGASPLTASVEVVCLTTNTVVRPPTPNSINGLTVPVVVTGDENEMVDLSNTKEKRRAILTVTFGVGDDFVDYVEFTVTRAGLDPNAQV